jgi:NADH:ubiquinone oxidoreductase subunit 6 (subunit J)
MPFPLFAADPTPAAQGWLAWLAQVVLALLRLWPVWLPLLAGGAAVFLLLPRPRPYPARWGALAGLAALVLAGVFLLPVTGVNPETVLFYAFAALALVAGALLVTQHNPARAALSFALVVLSTCGLFLLLAAPFLMAATVIIYAGAIVVTFLFVIMLAQPAGLSDADARSREPLLATLTGGLLLTALLYVVRLGAASPELDALLERTREAARQESKEDVERVVGDPDKPGYLFKEYKEYLAAQGWKDLKDQAEQLEMRAWFASFEDLKKALGELEALGERARAERARARALQPPAELPLSGLSGPPANTPAGDLRRDAAGRPQLPAENSAYLGRALFTDFLLPVELAGLLLLVTAIGAIAIAHRRGPQAGGAQEGPA